MAPSREHISPPFRMWVCEQSPFATDIKTLSWRGSVCGLSCLSWRWRLPPGFGRVERDFQVSYWAAVIWEAGRYFHIGSGSSIKGRKRFVLGIHRGRGSRYGKRNRVKNGGDQNRKGSRVRQEMHLVPRFWATDSIADARNEDKRSEPSTPFGIAYDFGPAPSLSFSGRGPFGQPGRRRAHFGSPP